MLWKSVFLALCVVNSALAAGKIDATVENFKIAVAKGDSSNPISVAAFAKAPQALKIDSETTITTTFSVKNKADGAAVSPQQVFVIFEHVESGNEITFVADNEKNGAYKVSVNFAREGDEFNGHSGKYKIHVVVGDVTLKAPLYWVFADADITVPEAGAEWVRKSEKISYAQLPEIKHEFRKPDKRPPSGVSDFFSLLCLAPIVVLFVLWANIGINFGNLPTSIFVPIFHFGLASLFTLYFIFWLQLNMFDTLKYMSVIGTGTFFAGNRLLKTIAEAKKTKTE